MAVGRRCCVSDINRGQSAAAAKPLPFFCRICLSPVPDSLVVSRDSVSSCFAVSDTRAAAFCWMERIHHYRMHKQKQGENIPLVSSFVRMEPRRAYRNLNDAKNTFSPFTVIYPWNNAASGKHPVSNQANSTTSIALGTISAVFFFSIPVISENKATCHD